ncbi:MAG: 2-amino-5-chloromuconate deaminase CnbZ [Alphaproteobacteria bacterium]
MSSVDFQSGGYRFIPGVFQYSAGVAALTGFSMRRIQFQSPVPLSEGFARAEKIIEEAGRPLTAFCACELRSPGQFSEDAFRSFNEHYVDTLSTWKIFDGSTNPVARSNVCPEVNGPTEPSFHAFTFTVAREETRPSFVIAGSGECPEGLGNYRDNTVRLGDLSAEGILEKARFVLDEMQRRQESLQQSWKTVTATQVYTVHDIYPFLASEIVGRGAAPAGITWHFDRPPVVDLEYEMDCRGVFEEFVI